MVCQNIVRTQDLGKTVGCQPGLDSLAVALDCKEHDEGWWTVIGGVTTDQLRSAEVTNTWSLSLIHISEPTRPY